MKVTFNSSVRKKSRKKTPITAQNIRIKHNADVPEYLEYHKIPEEFSLYKTPLLPKNSLNRSADSISEFHLTTSSYETRIVEITRKETEIKPECKIEQAHLKNSYCSKLDQIFDAKENEHIKSHEKLDVSELLKTKGDMLKETIRSMPSYFCALSDEYRNFRGKYEQSVVDLIDQKKINESLNKRINELVEDTTKKSETILQMMNENEQLKSKRAVFESYREERDRFMEILKKDSNDKVNEIQGLLDENSELKCKNSKLTVEKDILERDLRENRGNYARLEHGKNVLVVEIENLKKFAIDTLERHVNSEVFEDIERISLENRKVVYFDGFFRNVKATLPEMKRELKRLDGDLIQSKAEINFFIETQAAQMEDATSKLVTFEKERMEQNRVFSDVSDAVENIKKFSIELAEYSRELASLFSTDQIKKEFIKIISTQRKEFETQKQIYEKKIKELTNKLEGEEDIWDVFG